MVILFISGVTNSSHVLTRVSLRAVRVWSIKGKHVVRDAANAPYWEISAVIGGARQTDALAVANQRASWHFAHVPPSRSLPRASSRKPLVPVGSRSLGGVGLKEQRGRFLARFLTFNGTFNEPGEWKMTQRGYTSLNIYEISILIHAVPSYGGWTGSDVGRCFWCNLTAA